MLNAEEHQSGHENAPVVAVRLLQALTRASVDTAAAAVPGTRPGLTDAVLDAIDVGLVLTSHEAGLLHANRAARQACDTGLPLSLAGGRLHATSPADQPQLLSALLMAAQGRRTMLSLRRADWTYTVGVVPMQDHRTGLQAILFMLGDQPGMTRLNLQFLAQSHKLTFAESAVLTALAQGLSPAQIAQRGQVTIATVRSQITAIREKTNTASIAQLMRLVASLPPMARAGMMDS